MMKKNIRMIRAAVHYNFQGFFKNPKTILTLCLGFILCFLLSEKVLFIVATFDAPIQAIEPFLWTFGDTVSILLCSVLLIFLFSDLPRLGAATPFYLSRTGKWNWLAGQMIYLILTTMIYLGFVLFSTFVLCIERTFIGNIWSKTAALLGYSEVGSRMLIPSSVKVMESQTPYECMGNLFFLLLLYALTLGFLILAVNLCTGKNYGIFVGIGYSIFGYLLSPMTLQKITGLEDYELYKINVLLGWLSPLNHATFARHNFGYDKLPTIFQSYLLFCGILLVLIFVEIRALKRYNFTFLGK